MAVFSARTTSRLSGGIIFSVSFLIDNSSGVIRRKGDLGNWRIGDLGIWRFGELEIWGVGVGELGSWGFGFQSTRFLQRRDVERLPPHFDSAKPDAPCTTPHAAERKAIT